MKESEIKNNNMDQYAICVKDVYKNFNVYLDKANTIKDFFFYQEIGKKKERF